MTLNPAMVQILAAFAEGPTVNYKAATASEIRARFDNPMHMGPPIDMARIEDLHLDLDGRSLDARLYVPKDARRPAPVTLFFHGGGWVVGTLETHDGLCRMLAKTSGCAVLSIGYRLAPEHPYPAAVEDAFDSLLWLKKSAYALALDAERIAVAGDSAGGNLAGAVAFLARDKAVVGLRHQLLFYPVTDTDFSRSSYTALGGGDYFLTRDQMEWFWQLYLAGPVSSARPLAALMQQPNMGGLAPAHIITAEYDPLKDEGMAFAEKLKAAGVAVEAEIAPGMIHGFAGMYEAAPDVVPILERAGALLSENLKA